MRVGTVYTETVYTFQTRALLLIRNKGDEPLTCKETLKKLFEVQTLIYY